MSELSDDQKAWLAELLNRLPMVRWDRLTHTQDHLNVYGWIDRPRWADDRRDFLVLRVDLPAMTVSYVTSAARHSQHIGELIYGAIEHVDCERVEHVLRGRVENVVHLS